MRLARLSSLLLATIALSSPAWAVDVSNSAWNEADSSNTASPPNGWPAGMTPVNVEPSARQMMGAIKRFYNHINGTVTSGGGANAQTLTYSVAPGAYVTGDIYTFKVGASNTGATTLNVNGLGAITVQNGGGALVGGELVAGHYATVTYDGTNFQLTAPGFSATASPVFNNSQMNLYAGSLLNGISPSTEFFATYSFYATEALTGGISVPNTATVGQSNSVSAYANNASTTTNAVGVFSMSKSLASGTHNWTFNGISIDNGHPSTMLGAEFDANITSTSTVYNGVSVDGASGVQPATAGGFACGFLDTPVSPGSLAKWTSCFATNDGVASTGVSLGASAATGSSIGSQPFNWVYFNPSGTRAVYVMSVFGGTVFNLATTEGSGQGKFNIDGIFEAGGTAGITKTCSVMPTAMTIKGGIVTSVTGGTCS